MPRVISFGRDVPALKGKGRPWDFLFTMQLTAEYLGFAGRKELRAYRVAASNGLAGYCIEFPDKGTLVEWLREVLGMDSDDAYWYPEEVSRTAGVVPIDWYLSEDEVRGIGLAEPCPTFHRPIFS